jgi:hypothetical protein
MSTHIVKMRKITIKTIHLVFEIMLGGSVPQTFSQMMNIDNILLLLYYIY